jgi:hypothetical protein
MEDDYGKELFFALSFFAANVGAGRHRAAKKILSQFDECVHSAAGKIGNF